MDGLNISFRDNTCTSSVFSFLKDCKIKLNIDDNTLKEFDSFKWEHKSKVDEPWGLLWYMDYVYDDGEVHLKTNRKRIVLSFKWKEQHMEPISYNTLGWYAGVPVLNPQKFYVHFPETLLDRMDKEGLVLITYRKRVKLNFEI